MEKEDKFRLCTKALDGNSLYKLIEKHKFSLVELFDLFKQSYNLVNIEDIKAWDYIYYFGSDLQFVWYKIIAIGSKYIWNKLFEVELLDTKTGKIIMSRYENMPIWVSKSKKS